MTIIFTIGHSNHLWPKFASLLQGAAIGVVADVRTYPRSRFPRFDQNKLQPALAALGIKYVFAGSELGGRSGQSVEAPGYIKALDDVIDIARRHRTALMCSEHDPAACHRCALLGRSLVRRNIDVGHVLRDGRIESQADTESRLPHRLRCPVP